MTHVKEVFRQGEDAAGLSSPNGLESPRIGRLVVSHCSDEILVSWEGAEPRVARWVSGLSRKELLKPENAGREVLIIFEAGDPDRPVIVGLIEDPLENLVSLEVSEEPVKKAKDALIDGQRVVIEASEEIVLKCGDGSITLRKDGKIIIKGTHLLSRASGPIRVKGGSVQIN